MSSDSNQVLLLIAILIVITTAHILFSYFQSRQRSNKQESEKEDNLLSAIYHRGAGMYLVMDNKQKIEHINPALLKLLGGKEQDYRGKNFSALVIDEDQSLLKNLSPQKKDSFSIDLRLHCRDDEPLWAKIFSRNLQEDQKEKTLLFLQDIREIKGLEELLNFHATHDPLTLLFNRGAMEKYLNEELAIAREEQYTVAIIYINIDQLKVINDTCGYVAGDTLLQQVVTVVGEFSGQCDFFARVGGDEFALIKTNCDEKEAIDIAEQIRSAAEDFTFTWHNRLYRQSISIGVALSSEHINSVVDLLGAADSACSTAKSGGKNRVSSYSQSQDSSDDKRKDMMWVSRLQKAIQDSAFELYFHPIIQLSSNANSHIHYELLIRYVDDQGKHIEPSHFLPAVERFGLSEQVDLWVLTTALDFLHRHPHHTQMLNCCSINLTTQSIANPRIRSAILQVVESYDFPQEKICFEITETSAIHNLKEAQDFVKELKSFGCKLALDDFGTGFSSFGYLKNLDVDFIKIDGSFVKDITQDKFDRAMVSAINNMGKQMGIPIIAEYAASAKILSVLRELDVEFAQGYAISRPMPIYKLEDYYENHLRS